MRKSAPRLPKLEKGGEVQPIQAMTIFRLFFFFNNGFPCYAQKAGSPGQNAPPPPKKN